MENVKFAEEAVEGPHDPNPIPVIQDTDDSQALLPGEQNPIVVSNAYNKDAEVIEPDDHPQGEAIRQQVEFYFSDENLPNDKHLLTLCGGTQNLPVSIGEIMSWRKMRGYKPRRRNLFTLALKKSNLLEVCENDKRVRRKVALVLNDDAQERVVRSMPTPAAPLPAHLTKKMVEPTGLEETYCDPPITPAEHAENSTCYDPDLPLSQRIEIAIQRYKSKRKFHQGPARIFNSFLQYGGIECEAKQFGGGLSTAEMQQMDAADIALAKATHFCGADKDDSELWAVDFEGVAKGYLSDYFPTYIYGGKGEEEFELVTRVLMNFYNYLLHHNVCPEHTSGILAARNLCMRAKRELGIVFNLTFKLPGRFNEAVSMLMNGFYATIYGDRSWDTGASKDQEWSQKNMRIEEARILVLTGIMANGSDAMVHAVNDYVTSAGQNRSWIESLRCTKTLQNTGLEVIDIQLPTAEALQLYGEQNAMRKQISLQPVGKVVFKHWRIPDCSDTDFPPKSILRSAGTSELKKQTFEIWMEKKMLEEMFVGLYLCCTLRYIAVGEIDDPSIGFWHIDCLQRVSCSFYTRLLNELDVKSAPVRWLNKPEQDDSEDGGSNMSDVMSDAGSANQVASLGVGTDDDL